MQLTIETILRGTELGPAQSVGPMQMIPLTGEDDSMFAPPDLEVATTAYGTVLLRSDLDRPTIVPPGAGWVVPTRAQDHALGGGAILAPKQERSIDTAMCVQQTQPGYIRKGKHDLLILPAALRSKALSVRREKNFQKLWNSIAAYNKTVGLGDTGGHLSHFLQAFGKQLAELVAEVELIPRQVGAIVLIGGKIAGIERAPSAAFWEVLWNPLVRVCYGSLAIQWSQVHPEPPATRVPLATGATTLEGLRRALADVQKVENDATTAVVRTARAFSMEVANDTDDRYETATLHTVAGSFLAGQVVTVGDDVRYASICAAA